MKTNCYKILLFASFGILVSIKLIFCEEPQELPIEDRNPAMYADAANGIRYYRHLVAHGDYTRLKLIIRSDKKDYGPDEPVNIKFFVRNNSNSEIHLKEFFLPLFFHLWKLFHSNYDEVIKTSKGEEQVQWRKKLSWPKDDRHFFDRDDGVFGNLDNIKLQPDQEYEFECSIRLNDYFDLTKSDVYELTCFLPTVIAFQYYDPPLQSNTLTFRVLEDGEKAENLEEGMNPPKGEEVFKQPKPPKNVFYIYNHFTGEILLDESPTTIARQRAKERKVQAAQTPDEAKPSKE